VTAKLAVDVAHLLGASVLLLSFALLAQRRLSGVLKVFAAQAVALALLAAWQAHAQGAPRLYVAAGIALLFKAVLFPYALHRIAEKFDIGRAVENGIGMAATMVAAVALLWLSILLVLPAAAAQALTRVELALALAVVLLGFLMMIARRNALAQVTGFMSLENGLILSAVGVRGMPLVVEMSIALSILVAFVISGIFFFRIRERFDSLDAHSPESFRGERR
jgi:hydrogenase-4 component E